jgi:hypothetical protein
MEGNKLIFAIIGAVVLIGGAIAVAMRFVPQGEVTAAVNPGANDPEFKYFTDMANKCQGDFTKLPSEDQQALIKKCGNRGYAVRTMGNYWVPKK